MYKPPIVQSADQTDNPPSADNSPTIRRTSAENPPTTPGECKNGVEKGVAKIRNGVRNRREKGYSHILP